MSDRHPSLRRALHRTCSRPVKPGEFLCPGHGPVASAALPRPLLFVLQAGVLLAIAATALAAQTEFPFAAGTDATGRAQAVSDSTGLVMIESPRFPRGLWVGMVDEAGQGLPGIRVEYEESSPEVVIWGVDPSGERQGTLLWTGPWLPGVEILTLKSRAPANLPAGLVSIDWQFHQLIPFPPQVDWLVGWEAVSAFLRERWGRRQGLFAVRIDDSSIAVDMDRGAIEILVTQLQQMHVPLADSLADFPVFSAMGYDAGLLGRGVILRSSLFEDEGLEIAVREELGDPKGRVTLQQAASLTSLGAGFLEIRSLAGIEHFAGLEGLNLDENEIVDVSLLTSLVGLRSLSLNDNEIVDVSPLASLTTLEKLWLDFNEIVDVSPLAALSRLVRLNLDYNAIADLSPLAALNRLEWLALGGSQNADIAPLAGLTNLRYLYLSNHEIVDVTSLAGLLNLEQLSLGENQIVDVTPLAALVDLPDLSLWTNRISDVSPLAALTSLRILNLGHNRISDVSPLAALTSLERLVLNDNLISDVGPLASLASLKSLALDDNQIEEIGPLVANSGLGDGTVVNLGGNPLSDQAINEQIPALRARGVNVTY